MSLSRDPAVVLRGYLTAGDRAAFDEFDRWLHPNVVVHSPGGITSKGVDAQREAWAAGHAGLGGLHHDIQELVVADDAVAARVVASGTHEGSFLGIAPTGNHVQVDQALFARLQDGQIIELWEVVDTGSGMQQLGRLVGQALSFGPQDSP